MFLQEILRHLRKIQTHLLVALSLLACMVSAPAQAQSACTAIWGLINSSSEVAWLNTSSNSWVTVTSALNTGGAAAPPMCNNTVLGCNAMAGRNSDGLLYFVNRATRQVFTFNPANNVTTTLANIVPAPPLPATTTQVLGATFDAADRLHVYATSAGSFGTPSFVTFLEINPTTGAFVGTWTQARTTVGGTPYANISGDVFIDRGGATYFISNTNPPTLHPINLTPGASYARTTNTVSISGLTGSVQAVSVDPVTGNYYVATQANGTYRVTTPTMVATSINATAMGDMGNCPTQPAAPTVSKIFSPTFVTGGLNNRTATVRITIGNTNSQPIWTIRNLTDTLPTGMFIATPPSPTGSCYTNSATAFGTATFTAGATGNINILTANAKIPPGGCTLSFNVSATASLNLYTNTIPAGSLSTTAGSNAAGTTATLRVGTDFSAAKQVRAGTSGPFSNTTTIGIGRTMDYVLTFTNSAIGGTGTMTYTDTFRVGFTPVFALTFNTAGGATTCNGVTSTAALNQPRVTGTFAGPPGSSCSVTVTVRGSTTSVTTAVNTVTLAAGPTTGDSTTSNNIGTSTVTIASLTTLTIAKTVTPSGTIAPNTSVLYTVTISNLGPLSANNSLLRDPAVSGLSCSTATCTSAVGLLAQCPTQLSTTVAYLQGTGIQIATLSPTHVLTFRIGCTAN